MNVPKHTGQAEHLDKVDQRVERVCSHMTYEIATGVFAPDEKLPTVREAATRWSVDHRVVLKAYRQLEGLGLVRCVPRSGYFVATGSSHEAVSRHRYELQTVFDRTAAQVKESTNLSTLGTFRYLAYLAEIEARRKPECLFVECTSIQASGHAKEITRRLAVPCLSMTLDQIDGKATRIPPHVNTVFVTGFHFSELKGLSRNGSFKTMVVPIEVSPEMARPSKDAPACVFESDRAQAEHMSSDLKEYLHSTSIQTEVTDDINATLKESFGGSKRKRKMQAYLSPRLWGNVDSKWRDHQNVHLVSFRIAPSAWPTIAESIGLPLGAVAGMPE